MTTTIPAVPLRSPDRFYIDGDWVKPSSDSAFDVIDSHSEELYFRVAEAQPADMDLAIGAARRAFDHGPWPRLTHAERAGYLRAMADRAGARAPTTTAQIWPRESGVVHSIAQVGRCRATPHTLRFYADLATTSRSRKWCPRSRVGVQRGDSGCGCANPSAWSARSSRGTRRCR